MINVWNKGYPVAYISEICRFDPERLANKIQSDAGKWNADPVPLEMGSPLCSDKRDTLFVMIFADKKDLHIDCKRRIKYGRYLAGYFIWKDLYQGIVI